MNKMPVIQVFALGGTIAMTPDASSGVTPSLDAAALVSAVPALNSIANIRAETLAAIGSANITIKMITELCALTESSSADAVVVTQGTDTMEESAFVAGLLYKGSKPIVFTGAMRTADQPGADGPNNLYNAVLLAASGQAPKVSVLMDGTIHDPWHVAKEHTVALNAFISEFSGPLGHIIEHTPKIHGSAVSIAPIDLGSRDIPEIALITAGLGTDTRMLTAVEKAGYDGLVVEAFGAGHVSELWSDTLADIVTRIPVLLATRARGGPVLENSYGYKGAEIDLINRGLTPCGALKGRKARLLLSLLMAENPTGWRPKFTKILNKL